MTGYARIAALLLLGFLLAGPPGPARAQGGLASFERAELVIETAAGGEHRFDVELALTPDQRAQGLMYRRGLAEDAGMLFLYRRSGFVSMWMRNTLIPLDMIFIAADGRIAYVAERTVPHSLASISAGEAVKAVLELNGGTAARLAIRPGDRVLYPAFGGGS
jgi:uncharacterized membrane protein (UPF0127 family)